MELDLHGTCMTWEMKFWDETHFKLQTNSRETVKTVSAVFSLFSWTRYLKLHQKIWQHDQKDSEYTSYYLPRQQSRLEKRSHLCVCVCASVCVCLFVSAITAELFNIWSRNLVLGLTLIISLRRLLVKVIDQRSRSRGKKMSFSGFSDLSKQISSLGLWCDVITSHDVMRSRRDVICRHITSHNTGDAATLYCFYLWNGASLFVLFIFLPH